MEITHAWIYAPTLNLHSKQMKFDDVAPFCKEHGLGVWDNGKVVDIKDYPLEPVRESIMTYGFYTGSYLTEPSITLVPFGTTVDFGRFVFPKTS